MNELVADGDEDCGECEIKEVWSLSMELADVMESSFWRRSVRLFRFVCVLLVALL